MGVTLEHGDIQGNIVRGYGFDHARYVFVRVEDAAHGRAWLGRMAPHVTSAQRWAPGTKPPVTRNVALAYAGLAALSVGDDVLASFPDDFREGMARRAGRLGDTGASDPGIWEDGLRGDEIHVLLTLNARRAEDLEPATRELLAEAAGVTVTKVQDAAVLPDAREHFGFSDGFAQPPIAGEGRAAAGRGIAERRRFWQRARPDRVFSADGRTAWRALRAGEFVLGYRDEDGVVPAAPKPPFDRNGTFMVWRKLEQDVAGFREAMSAHAKALGDDADRLAAKLVGRWQDGSPLELAPDAPDPMLGRTNDFTYAADADGRRCPRGAHIRRTNPRDALRGGATLTARHRIMRRGMPYGPPLDDGPPDAARGLVFVCLQASIARQFETIQGEWCNDGNVFGLGEDPDPITGAREAPARALIEGDPPRMLMLRSYVTTRGGEYLFVPGLRALHALAG